MTTQRARTSKGNGPETPEQIAPQSLNHSLEVYDQ